MTDEQKQKYRQAKKDYKIADEQKQKYIEYRKNMTDKQKQKRRDYQKEYKKNIPMNKNKNEEIIKKNM